LTGTISRARGRLIGLAGVIVAALSLAPSALAGNGMIEYTTAHYSVKTDITPRFAAVIGDHMETIYREYARRFQGFGEVEQRFDVKVFRTRRQYEEATGALAPGSTGAFIVHLKLLAAHAEGRTAEEVLRTLYHEGFHQFMYYAISKECPIWLNEGLAEYFSEATWNGKEFETGQVPSGRLHVIREAIRTGTYVPLHMLVTMSNEQWLQNCASNDHRASIHYCQAWSLAQFLLHANGGRYAPMMSRFLRELADGHDQEEAFVASFGADLRAFEQTWARYVMSLRPSPKFTCRDNMEALMTLARSEYGDVRKFRSVSELRKKVRSSRNRWSITFPTGKTFNSSDKQAVAALFRCPLDRSVRELSYFVVNDPKSGMPILVCTHHPGIVIKAYFQRQRSGELKVMVEEEVYETLKDGLRQAIQAAQRQ